jgi:hypothetical protein
MQIGANETTGGGLAANVGHEIADIAVWAGTLTADERAALNAGVSPALIRPDILAAYWPGLAAEPDWLGDPFTTITGATKADHPRVYMAGKRRAAKAFSLSAFTLSAAQGTYSYTGQAAAFLVGTVLASAQGSYSYTGQAAGLSAAYIMPADAGSYSYSGQAAALLAGSLMTADAGVFSYTGQDASLTYGRIMPAAQGSYSYTGQPVTFTLAMSVTLSAVHGVYSYTGQAAALGVTSRLIAAMGSYSYIGQAARALLNLDEFPAGGGGSSRPTVVAAFLRR